GVGQMFRQNMDDEQVTAKSKAVVQQQFENDEISTDLQLQNVLKQVNTTMQEMSDQQKEITELREKVERVKEKQPYYETEATTKTTKKEKWLKKQFNKEKKPSTYE